MSNIDTISDLMTFSNTQFRLFDLGRKVTKLSKEQFLKVELNQQPYPYPIQGHAMFAICFWQKQTTTPYFWFTKIPLDERGLLNQGARNHFIAIIIEALGNDLCVDPTERQEELLQANPYIFQPAGYKLAALNSMIKNELKQPASIHYEHFQQYMAGQLNWQEWQNIGLQGICDFAAKHSEKNNLASLVANLDKVPKQVLFPLLIALENQALNHQQIDALIALNNDNNEAQQLHLFRALASSSEHPHVKAFITEKLAQGELTNDILITLASRCWVVFEDKLLLLQFLEQLAVSKEAGLFAAIFKDLVAIPSIRPQVFACMRSDQRSPELAKAIGLLFNQQKN